MTCIKTINDAYTCINCRHWQNISNTDWCLKQIRSKAQEAFLRTI